MAMTRAQVPGTDAGTGLPAHVPLLVAALAAGVVAQGGYYLRGRALIAVVVAAAMVAALLVRRWTATDAWPVPVACAALGLWAVARSLAAPGAGTVAAAGAVATLGCLAVAVMALRRTGPAARERCAEAMVGVGVLVAVTAWVGVAWRIPRFAVLVELRLWRGASTLTYPNAAAALLVPLALLAIALLVAHPRSLVRAAASYLLLVGAGAALSRAGFVALAAGFVVVAVLAGIRATAWHAAPLVLGAALAVAALVPSFVDSAEPRPALALAGLLAGAVVAIGTVRTPPVVRATGLVVTLAVAALVPWSRLGGDRLQAVLASRGNLDSYGRTEAARSAVALIAEHPWIGAGIGSARFAWARPDGNVAIAQYAHNEYLQTLVDLGTVGGVLLLGLLAAIVVTLHRGRRSADRSGVWAGAVAAMAALAVHSAFDFLWHIAVLPLAAGLFIGLAAPATSEEPTQRGPTGPPEEEEQQ